MKITHLINIVSVIVMSIIFLPVLHSNISTSYLLGVNLFTMTNMVILLHALILLKKADIFVSRPMILVYSYYAIYILMRLSGYYDVSSQWFGQYCFPVYLSTLLINYYYKSNDEWGLSFVAVSIVLFIIVSSAISSVQLIRNPLAVRGVYGVATAGRGEVMAEYYRRIGVTSYNFISGVSFLIPSFVYLFKIMTSIKYRILAAIAIVILLYNIFLSAISGALVVAFLGAVIAFMGRKRLRSSIILIAFIFMTLLIFPKVIVTNGLYLVAGSINNQDMANKVRDIGTSYSEGIDMSSPSNSIEFRAERIPRNFEKFLMNPIFGIGLEENAHIFWLNQLAQFGLLGTIPLLLILYKHVNINRMHIRSSYEYYYYLSIAMFILLGLMKAVLGDMFYYILIVAPSINYLQYRLGSRQKARHPVLSKSF